MVACARRITGKATVAPTTFKNLRRAQSIGVRDAVNIDNIKVTFSVSDLFFLICGYRSPCNLIFELGFGTTHIQQVFHPANWNIGPGASRRAVFQRIAVA